MSAEERANTSDLLTESDKVNGFSITVDEAQNVTLFKCGRPIAWFSAQVSIEVLKGFFELVRQSCEKSGRGR
jgi:hypothetical protein